MHPQLPPPSDDDPPTRPYSAQPYSAQPYSGPPPHVVPVMVAQTPTSGFATASMIVGILGVLGGWCLFGLPCLVAIVLGHIAYGQTRHGARGGHGMAITGLILGYLFLVPWVVVGFLFLVGNIPPPGSE